MTVALIVFRILLVVLTAIFMAFHTQIFIGRIEQNFVFSWMASLVIEGMIISLALMRTVFSRILLIPLFVISVVSASASFIVQNEGLLNSFFKDRRVIEQLRGDITETQNQFSFNQKYTTKTLMRERRLKDELQAALKGQKGDITIANSLIFFLLVLVMQTVSIYTATALKDIGLIFLEKDKVVSGVSGTETESFQKVSAVETKDGNTETFTQTRKR
ncbi:MAG: hypothetical protein HY754_11340 [Nitrospirae bacterium]|nr:hypothetical protein [Nitrospirota bacterium]